MTSQTSIVVLDTKWTLAGMNMKIILLIFFQLIKISGTLTTDDVTLLGCFNANDLGENYHVAPPERRPPSTSITGDVHQASTDTSSNDSDHLLNWCIQRCGSRNKTFAAIKQSKFCLCGDVLGEARRVPMLECLTPCSHDLCGQPDRILAYILGMSELEGYDSDITEATSSTVDVNAVNLRQVTVLAGGVAGGVVLAAVLIHCARVCRRRERLLQLYICQLETGGREPRKPPGCLSISNSVCADFFCCCCHRTSDDLDYDELLGELDIGARQNKSFTGDVKEYIKRCIKEKNMGKKEILRLVKSFNKRKSKSKTGGSFGKLAERYIDRQRKLDNSDLSLRGAKSCPPKLCRAMKGSSMSSMDRAFRPYNSNISMYMNGSLARTLNNKPERGSFTLQDVSSLLAEDSVSSQGSSTRLIPVSTACDLSSGSRRSRLGNRHSSRAVRAPSETSDNDTDNSLVSGTDD